MKNFTKIDEEPKEDPSIEHREYDLSKPGDRIDLRAFSEDWGKITSVEY
jgi:hypothetical protein